VTRPQRIAKLEQAIATAKQILARTNLSHGQRRLVQDELAHVVRKYVKIREAA
jgi:hypothetical protein